MMFTLASTQLWVREVIVAHRFAEESVWTCMFSLLLRPTQAVKPSHHSFRLANRVARGQGIEAVYSEDVGVV